MRRYTVYRMNRSTRKKEAVGGMIDRRRTEREMRQNVLSLLAEARELFGEGQGETIVIAPVTKKPPAASNDGLPVAKFSTKSEFC